MGAWFMDRMGRRPMLLIAMGGCCCCLTLEAALVAVYAEAGTNKAALGAALFAFYLFLSFYSSVIDTSGFVYSAELFPNHLRAKGLVLRSRSPRSVSLTSSIFRWPRPHLRKLVGSFTWYVPQSPLDFHEATLTVCLEVYIVVTALGFIWMCFNVPETKGVLQIIHQLVFGSHEQGADLTREITKHLESLCESKGDCKAEVLHTA